MTHGLRNEMPICLQRLHKLIYYSRFVLARDQKNLYLMNAGEPYFPPIPCLRNVCYTPACG